MAIMETQAACNLCQLHGDGIDEKTGIEDAVYGRTYIIGFRYS